MKFRIIPNTSLRYIVYRIQPNYRPCPHNPPPDFLLYFHLLSSTWRSFGTSGREQINVSTPGTYLVEYSIIKDLRWGMKHIVIIMVKDCH